MRAWGHRSLVWWIVLGLGLVLVVGCGGDGDPSGEEITERVADAVSEVGMVYHAVGDDGSEVWIDAENELFRSAAPTAAGGVISVGDGWMQVEYDPAANAVADRDLSPAGPTRPRLDHPMIRWLEPLGALAFAQEFDVIGETSADGRIVLAVEARTPISSDGQATGRTLVGRVEVDPDTYLPLAYESREDVPPGQEPGQQRERIVYTTSELIPQGDLPDGWFGREAVTDQALTVEEALDELRLQGITPYWLGENYESETGILSLPPNQTPQADPLSGEAVLSYALIVPVSDTNAEPVFNAVLVRLAASTEGFGPPDLPQLAGASPEETHEVEVRGMTAELHTSILAAVDLGCGDEECPPSDALVYRRLILTIGETGLQIEAFAKLDTAGGDLNGFNTRDGIVELAEALVEAMG